jgi:hypothetical protein
MARLRVWGAGSEVGRSVSWRGGRWGRCCCRLATALLPIGPCRRQPFIGLSSAYCRRQLLANAAIAASRVGS